MIISKWYAVYVRSRNEKKVEQRLTDNHIENYLPLMKTLRQWKDRKKMVEVPLFNSYVFVFVTPKQFHAVLKTEGVVNFIKLDGKPNFIPEDQIISLKLLLESSENFEISTDIIEPGESVEVIKGVLKGFRGMLIKYKGKRKAQLKIEAINQSLIVDISPGFLKRIKEEEIKESGS